MKAQLKNTIALFVAMLALSIGTGVQSANAASSAPLLKLSHGGGMPGPDGYTSQELTLYTNGKVIYTHKLWPMDGEPIVSSQLVAKITNAKFIARVQDVVGQLNGGELALKNPNEPECMDAPGSTYAIIKDGQAVPVAQVQACRWLELVDQDQQWHAAEVVRILEALEVLAR